MKAYLSVVGNLLFPGLGHYYIGEKGKAVCFALIVSLTYFIGLGLDLQHYYWYEGVTGGTKVIQLDQSAGKFAGADLCGNLCGCSMSGYPNRST